LFERYFDAVWDEFGTCLLSPFPAYYNLKHLLSASGIHNSKATWLFEDSSRCEKLFEWLGRHGIAGAKRIASLIPLGVRVDERVIWHPFSRKFIDLFGNFPGVLDELAANMGTFGSTGSTEGYYTNQKLLLQELNDSRLLEVRDWASAMIRYTDKQIKISRLEDEGRNFS
jgi:hypothetical protein